MIKRNIRLILSNVCIICGISLLVICILDWFNPYMDFLGHSLFLVYILCGSSILLGVWNVLMKIRR